MIHFLLHTFGLILKEEKRGALKMEHGERRKNEREKGIFQDIRVKTSYGGR